MDPPDSICRRESGPNEKAFTKERERALLARIDQLLMRIDQLEALWRSAEERAGLGEIAALKHAERVIALERKLKEMEPKVQQSGK